MLSDVAGPVDHSDAPLKLNAVLDEGFRVTRRVFWPVLAVVLITHAPGLLALLIGYVLLDSGPAVDIDPYRFSYTLVGSVALFAIFQTLCEPISVAATYLGAERGARGQRCTVGGLLFDVLRRFGPIFAVGALYYGAVYGLLFISAGGLTAVGAALWAALEGQTGVAVVLFVGGGLVALVALPAAVWFLLRFGFCLADVVVESERPPMGSFGRSVRMMRGIYLPVSALLLVLLAVQMGLLILAGSFFPSVPLQSADPDFLFEHMPGILRAQLLHQAVAVTVSTTFSIYAGACWIVAYLRRRSLAAG